MEISYAAANDIQVLSSHVPVPGLGVIPANAFVIRASEPVLVDAGVAIRHDGFLSALCALVDPEDLRWLWLTHTDPDHIGGVRWLLDMAPALQVITTFVGAAKMALHAPLPMERVYILNPGQSIDLGDRRLTAVKPPVYDAPETTGLHDSKSGALFSADCFGAVLPAPVEDARLVAEEDLVEAQMLWATVDSPWLHYVDRAYFADALDEVRRLAPTVVLSSHLPKAPGMLEQFLGTLLRVPERAPFVGPDHAAVQATLAQVGQVQDPSFAL